MPEYIDREKAVDALLTEMCMTGYQSRAINVIRMIEKEDVAPVVHAQWGEYEVFPLAPSMNGYPCGNCGMHFSASSVPILKYCPNCGAKMDGGN